MSAYEDYRRAGMTDLGAALAKITDLRIEVAELTAENEALRTVVDAARKVTDSITGRTWTVSGGHQHWTTWTGSGDALQALSDALDALDEVTR